MVNWLIIVILFTKTFLKCSNTRINRSSE